MYVVGLQLKNFRCFAGEQALSFAPIAYSIVARRASDSDRSNFCGKTSLIEAVGFVLYGRHSAVNEDAWIFRGAGSGGATLVLDDGTKIERYRSRGGSSKLTLTASDGSVATGKEAQAKIGATIGLSEEDSAATWLVEQKRMSRLATACSSDLLATFSDWFGLDPLDRCRSAVRSDAVERTAKELTLAAERSARDVDLRATLGGASEDELRAAAQKKASGVETVRATIDAFLVERAEASAAMDARRGAERFDALVAEGKEVDAELRALATEDALVAEAKKMEDALAAADRAFGEAEAEMTRRRVVASGKFDGCCPIAEIRCPARDEINRGRTSAVCASEDADVALEEARRVRRERAAECVAASNALVTRKMHRADLDRIKAECEALVPVWKAARRFVDAPDPAEVDRRIANAHASLADAERERLDLEACLHRAKIARAAIEKLDVELAEIRAEVRTRREAEDVFDRARKIVAERGANEVEVGANELLRAAGIPISLTVRWGRDGVGHAAACRSCGRPFGRSAKEKACAGCGCVRGPNLVERVDVELSDRSGATEDLAGWALQLSAFRWLRRARSSSWDVVVFDEPLSALDRSLRRAFAAHLTGMLSATARQAFVIAHQPDVLSALPGRIEIVSDGKTSRAEVVT